MIHISEATKNILEILGGFTIKRRGEVLLKVHIYSNKEVMYDLKLKFRRIQIRSLYKQIQASTEFEPNASQKLVRGYY